MRILIVEDEVRLAEALAQIMAEQKYQVDQVHNGADGLDYALTAQYDVIVLDVMLPKRSGYEIVHALRKEGDKTPVLMLTARTEVEDRINGLDSGADYYLTKPFDSNELLACIRAITRRNTDAVDNALAFGDLRLELDTCQLSCGERSVRLSKKEFAMMEKLMANSGKVVTKEQLLLSVWGYESDAEDNNVEVYISFLRKKLKHLKSFVSIKTLRMVGYTLQEVDQ